MNHRRQQGFSLITTVMVLQVFSMVLLTALNQRLSEQLRLYSDERQYLPAYNQAVSSLSWGFQQHWPVPGDEWQCLQQNTYHLLACLKLSSRPDLALLVGYSQLQVAGDTLRLYQWVKLPADWQNVSSIILAKQPQGWLDFCPHAKEAQCR